MPELVPAVCPRRWAIHRVFGTRSDIPWSTTELRQAFDTLLPLARRRNYKLALFIDGLDEFEVTDKFRFLLSFAETARAEDAKVCVSSREWTVFSDYFRSNPSLRLQDLTRGDIERYIRGHLDKNVAYAELKESDADGLKRLVASVLDKASGVFLWVRMVTEVVLTGMDAGETVKELNERVDELPPDLCDLYQGIWNKLDPKDRTTVARLLRILETCIRGLDAPTIIAAEQPDAEEALKMPLEALEKLVIRRLRSQTRGLLELSNSGEISYLHRTARDWSLTIKDEMQKMLPPDFDPRLQLFLAKVALMTILHTPGSWHPPLGKFWDSIGHTLEYASGVVIQSNDSAKASKLFAALDRLETWAADTWKASRHRWRSPKPGSSSEDEQDMHWSSYQLGGYAEVDAASLGYSNTFLGVACQYAMLPYVKQKLEVCPQLITPKRNEVSLLENALPILESTHLSHSDIDDPSFLGPWFPQREALIRLLLSHGTDPRAESLWLFHIHKPMAHLNTDERFAMHSLSLHKTVQALSAKTGLLFWRKVQDIFDESMKNRGPISRLRAKLGREHLPRWRDQDWWFA